MALSEPETDSDTNDRGPEQYLGAIVRDTGTRYQIVALEDTPAAPELKTEPTLVGETDDGHTKRWGFSTFTNSVDVLSTEPSPPERPDPVVPLSVQSGLLTERIHYQNNGVVRCSECGDYVREPDATPVADNPAETHSYARWTCHTCSDSALIDGNADALDLDTSALEACPYARWSDHMQLWTLGSDYRRDDSLWQPDEIEPAQTIPPEQKTSYEADASGTEEMRRLVRETEQQVSEGTEIRDTDHGELGEVVAAVPSKGGFTCAHAAGILDADETVMLYHIEWPSGQSELDALAVGNWKNLEIVSDD